MEISLVVFGALYVLIVLIMGVVGIVHIGMAFKYGMRHSRSAVATAIFLATFAAIVGGTIIATRDVDWSMPFNVTIPRVTTGS